MHTLYGIQAKSSVLSPSSVLKEVIFDNNI